MRRRGSTGQVHVNIPGTTYALCDCPSPPYPPPIVTVIGRQAHRYTCPTCHAQYEVDSSD